MDVFDVFGGHSPSDNERRWRRFEYEWPVVYGHKLLRGSIGVLPTLRPVRLHHVVLCS